ncbi:hypothetical protein OIE49_36075 [Streptomyces sp. NBC_01788]|nr:hypothetical protein OIE49_36075 [Streptomyces sp. NBC_01788]
MPRRGDRHCTSPELAVRRRIDGLREEVDRIQAQLAAAEQEWQGWAIARRRVDTVLAPDSGNTADAEVTEDPRHAARSKSQVPVWREGLDWSVLSVDYQRILKALADRLRLSQGPLTCREMAAAFRHGSGVGTGGSTGAKAKRQVARP